MQENGIEYGSQENGMVDEKTEVNMPKPVAFDRFIAKRFKNVPTPVLKQRLIDETDYCQYYPEFIAKGLSRERVIEMLIKFLNGESHKPTFARSEQFEYGKDKHLPYFPGTDPKDCGDGNDTSKN